MKVNKDSITNYETFAAWHAAHMAGYVTPTREQVIKSKCRVPGALGAEEYDAERDVFFRFTGKFHDTPGLRIDTTWGDIAQEHVDMYYDFAVWGTD
jgi:hypothetical protein